MTASNAKPWDMTEGEDFTRTTRFKPSQSGNPAAVITPRRAKIGTSQAFDHFSCECIFYPCEGNAHAEVRDDRIWRP